MTMVERMARVWAKESGDPEDYWPKYQREVLLILEAMREPSQTMLDADVPGWWADASPDVVWKAMIDAAIAEHAATAIGNRRA